MKKEYSQFIGLTYYFMDSAADILELHRREMKSVIEFDFEKEKIIACIFGRKDAFIIITDDRVIAKKVTGLDQHTFKEMTGVDRGLTNDVVLVSPGNKSNCFGHGPHMPKKELLDLVFKVISSQWNKVKNESSKSDTSDIPSQIEKLAKLKDQGILTEEEFQNKKKDLLSKM